MGSNKEMQPVICDLSSSMFLFELDIYTLITAMFGDSLICYYECPNECSNAFPNDSFTLLCSHMNVCIFLMTSLDQNCTIQKTA